MRSDLIWAKSGEEGSPVSSRRGTRAERQDQQESPKKPLGTAVKAAATKKWKECAVFIEETSLSKYLENTQPYQLPALSKRFD